MIEIFGAFKLNVSQNELLKITIPQLRITWKEMDILNTYYFLGVYTTDFMHISAFIHFKVTISYLVHKMSMDTVMDIIRTDVLIIQFWINLLN